jgi:hypothetical protein
MPASFSHRVLIGWISEFANRMLPGQWPQIPLDDETLADFDQYFDLCTQCGYGEVVIWGFFVDRRWPVDIASSVSADRRSRIARLVQAAHDRGLRVLSGLGVYSWGFDAIIEANPHLSRTNPSAMCPSVAESRSWMERVTDFVMGGFELDGLNLQSADLGRCTCPECVRFSTVEYHTRLIGEAARYIDARWPGKTLVMDNWGCPFSDPADLPHLAALSREISYIVDHNDSSEGAGRQHRRDLIAALQCPFGTLAGRSVWPPQRWRREKWFLPITLTNVDYLRALYADGGRAAEQFVTTLANPSGEISLRFMGMLLADVDADPGALLSSAVEATYHPSDRATLDGLVEMVSATERAYFENSGRTLGPGADLLYIDGGLLTKEDPSPETYLRDMSPAGRAAYAKAISAARDAFSKLQPRVGRTEKAALTGRCFETILEDISRFADA